MFEDHNDFYSTPLFDDSNNQFGNQEFKPSAATQVMLGDVEGLIPDFSPWPSTTSYAMESTPSNCSTSSTCSSSSSTFSSVLDNSNQLTISPPLSASTSSSAADFYNSWPMEPSSAIDSLGGHFHEPYTTALTPPSDGDYIQQQQQQQQHHHHLHQQQQQQQHQQQQANIYCEPSQTTTAVGSQFPTISTGIEFQTALQSNFPSSPPSDLTGGISLDDPPKPQPIVPTTYTKWVKLTRMTDERINQIKTLAVEKGIDLDTVESVLTLYSQNQNQRVDNEVNKFCGDDVYIKITMGGSSTNDDADAKSRGRRRSDGSIAPPKKKHRKQRPNYVKRPLNSFMLYRKSQTQSAMAYAISSKLKLNHQNISQIIGLMWQTESKELKEEFAKFAGQEKELHRAMHPDYKFCPQKKNKK